jgi:hypothetical protein
MGGNASQWTGAVGSESRVIRTAYPKIRPASSQIRKCEVRSLRVSLTSTVDRTAYDGT